MHEKPIREPMPPALELKDVSHTFGDLQAITGLNLSIEAGQVTCLLGPSGCGKTTALRIAAGLETLQSGEIYIAGNLAASADWGLPAERRGIGLVFQDYALFPHLSVVDNVMFGVTGNQDQRRACAMAALEQVQMVAHCEDFPHTLSGGQQQRVALARALAPKPAVVLLDEPYSGLDARLRDQVRDEVLHVLKDSGAATLMVTHDSEEAMFMADQICVLKDGKMVQSGPPESLYRQPISAFVAGFFGEVTMLPAVVNNGVAATVIGDFPAPDLGDNTAATVVVRPEALLLEKAPAACTDAHLGMIIQARMLGRSSLVHVSVTNTVPPSVPAELHLHARVGGVFLPAAGERVRIAVDQAQSFVFPLN